MADRLIRLVDLAAEIHGVNRTEITVSLGVAIARIDRVQRDAPAITLASVLPMTVLGDARDGLDGVATLAASLRVSASHKLGNEKRAVEEARKALVSAEARAARTSELIEELKTLAVSGGTDG